MADYKTKAYLMSGWHESVMDNYYISYPDVTKPTRQLSRRKIYKDKNGNVFLYI